MAEVTIKSYLQSARFVREQLPEVIIETMMKKKDDIIEMNRQQLYDGKDIYGNDIRPLYTEDSFFKTDAQAKGYIKWKQKITPNANRNPNAPNLFINGYYHRSLGLIRSGLNIFIRSLYAGGLGSEISNKYKNTLGLNYENQQKLDRLIFPEVINFIKKYL